MRAGVRGLRTITLDNHVRHSEEILSQETLLDLVVPLADMFAFQPIIFTHPLD
jgi:hypothetical protein